MSDTVIRVENLGKKYVLSHQDKQSSYKSFRDVLSQGTKNLFASIAPVRKADLNGHQPSTEEFWALNDVSFEIKQGDRVGIIGRNGAGKSTLLKILSRITEPTKGKIQIKGRVASLLEVGTGFHAELTGRENIFLNGAILGMSKAEIKRKFDEIVAFAEVEKFLDTPVKRYSSGMYVRLAFAVAAHLDPEILIVDEVLAVGDANFQRKCLGKMQDISRKQEKTILFVSHSMEIIQRLCSQCIMLEKGQLVAYGETSRIVQKYIASGADKILPSQWIDLSRSDRVGTGKAQFKRVRYSSLNELTAFQPYPYSPLELYLEIFSSSLETVNSLAIIISNQSGTKLVNADIVLDNQVLYLEKGSNLVRFEIEKLYLNPGNYTVGLWLSKSASTPEKEALDYLESAFEIEVVFCSSAEQNERPNYGGFVTCRCQILNCTGSYTSNV